MLRIGTPPYLSAAPFHRITATGKNEFELILAPPRQLGHLARKGELAAACVSLADALRLRQRFESLGDYGIAAAGTPVPPAGPLLCLRNESAARGHHPIGIPREAATAGALLEAVWRLTRRETLAPRIPLSPDRGRLGGFVLIGDDAITAAHAPSEHFPYTLNLAAEWQRCTDLPWVFGWWIVRKDLADAEKARLRAWLDETAEIAAEEPERFAAAYCRANEPPWPEDVAIASLRAFTYRLTGEHRRTVERFRRELRAVREKEAPLFQGGTDASVHTV